MHKFTLIALAGVVAFALAAFGPRPWNEPAAVEHASAVSPFALTISAGPIPVALSPDTF